MKSRTVKVPPVLTRCELRAESIDREARTVGLTFYSGSPVLRFPLFDDPFEIEFEMSAKAADLSRLNAGASVLDNHDQAAGVRSILGVVQDARISGGEGRAAIRFSNRPDVEPIWQDVQDGIIRHVSMGTYVTAMEDVTPKGADLKRFRATGWQPYELSLVPVPADAGAIITDTAAQGSCRLSLNSEDTTMRLKKCPACSAKLTDADTEECPGCSTSIEELTAQLAESGRRDHIHRIAAYYRLGDVWAQKHIAEGTDALDALSLATKERAKTAPQGPNDNGMGLAVGLDHDAPAERIERMALGIHARATKSEPADAGREFYHMTLGEAAVECLRMRGLAREIDWRRPPTWHEIELALHTTSDYPLLLANALNKELLPEYREATPTYRSLCQRKNFNDFRPHSMTRAGNFPALLEVNEHGEVQYGTMSESAETVTAATYSRIYAITRKVLVNDDLGAFSEIAVKAARRVVAVENALFFAVLTAAAGVGPDMSDGNPLFDAAHGNTGSGAIDVTNVGTGWASMMKQTSLDGLKLNIPPSLLLVSPDRIAVARQFVAQNLRPTQPSEANPFSDLVVLADAELTSAAPWYLCAGPDAGVGFIYGYVGGEGPRTMTREGFEIEGLEYRVSLDFGVGAIDWRGLYRSTGS